MIKDTTIIKYLNDYCDFKSRMEEEARFEFLERIQLIVANLCLEASKILPIKAASNGRKTIQLKDVMDYFERKEDIIWEKM